MKKHLPTLALVLMLLAGIALVLYPTVSDYWNSLYQTRAIEEHAQSVSEMEQADYSEAWAAAREYNQRLLEKENRFNFSDEDRAEYGALLNAGGDGLMAYLEIPVLESELAVYHGTDEMVLQTALGHMEGSSLPVGGPGSHCVISGHTGLPAASLFTSLDRMKEGDLFMLHVLDETLTYEVDQILVVLPEQMEPLEIDPAQDLCTLITCTPYAINSHRLLVRGHRVENLAEHAPRVVMPTAVRVNSYLVAAAIALPLMTILILVWLVQSRKR